MRVHVPFYVALLFGALLPSCTPKPNLQSHQSGIIQKSAKWENPGNIPVCIINKQKHGDIVEVIEQAITSEYAKTKAVRFKGWGDCKDANLQVPMIKLNILTPDQTNIGGCSIIGPTTQNTLDCDKPVEGSTWVLKIDPEETKGLALHEFGHAIGLLHEHTRTDRPAGENCKDHNDTVAQDDQVGYVGAYDRASIMAKNYCEGAGNTLSPGDIEAINTLYGDGGNSNNVPSIDGNNNSDDNNNPNSNDNEWGGGGYGGEWGSGGYGGEWGSGGYGGEWGSGGYGGEWGGGDDGSSNGDDTWSGGGSEDDDDSPW